MVTVMGVESNKHFVKSFRNQGFTDTTLEKWKPRKRTERSRSGSRAILVKSGNLRRSVRWRKYGKNAVINYSNLPYAKVHNEGGVINKQSRIAILSFNRDGFFAKTRTKKQRAGITYQQKTTISAHSIRMPKRQFVGYSKVMNGIIVKKINKIIKRVYE